MSAPVNQHYSNHARIHPPFHYVLVPILLIHSIWSIVRMVQDPGWDRAEAVLLSMALFVLAILARIYALKVQDRVIRLEEQIRYARVLPAELAQRALALTPGQIVALRFASDDELASRVEEVLSGKVLKSAEIKKGIREWRADYLRV